MSISIFAISNRKQQLLYTDASLFDLGAIADLILSQDDVGSTVKTDGADSDPLGFLAVLNLNAHRVSRFLSALFGELTSGLYRATRRWRISGIICSARSPSTNIFTRP